MEQSKRHGVVYLKIGKSKLISVNFAKYQIWHYTTGGNNSMVEVKKTRSELKREAIVSAAKRAFQRDGVQGTSMDKIAEEAQVSKRTVYNHFKAKENLVIHILSSIWKSSMVDSDDNYQSGQPLKPQLVALIKSEIDVISSAEYLNLTRVAFGHFMYSPEDLKQESAVFRDYETVLQRWLKRALQDKRLKPLDIEKANKQIHSLVKGSCFWPQLMCAEAAPTEAEKLEIAESTAAMFLAYYQSGL